MGPARAHGVPPANRRWRGLRRAVAWRGGVRRSGAWIQAAPVREPRPPQAPSGTHGAGAGRNWPPANSGGFPPMRLGERGQELGAHAGQEQVAAERQNLAEALARTGRFVDAVTVAGELLPLAQQANRPPMVQEVQRRLRGYQQAKVE